MSKFKAQLEVQLIKKYVLKFNKNRIDDFPADSWTRYEVKDVVDGGVYVFNLKTDDPRFSSKKPGDTFTIVAEPAGDQRVTVFVPKLRRVELI